MSVFLSQNLSTCLGGNSSVTGYVFPTARNLSVGAYFSEILDVKEVLRSNGSLEALDFYHKLIDVSGSVLYVRFRYYENELPGLAQLFKRYPVIETWSDTVGLLEDVDVTPKITGQYLHISGRSLSTTGPSPSLQSAQPIGTTVSAGLPAKKGRGILSASRKVNGVSLSSAKRQSVVDFDEDDEENDDDEYLD